MDSEEGIALFQALLQYNDSLTFTKMAKWEYPLSKEGQMALALYNSQLNHFGKRAHKEMSIPHPAAKASEKRITGASFTLEEAQERFKTTISTLSNEEIREQNKRYNIATLIKRGI